MTAEPSVADVLDAVKVGAAGCLSSSLEPARLAAAVSAVAAGEASFPRLQLRQANQVRRLLAEPAEEVLHLGGGQQVRVGRTGRVRPRALRFLIPPLPLPL